MDPDLSRGLDWMNFRGSFHIKKDNVAVQADPLSLSGILVSGKSNHISPGIECVALQQVIENLWLLSMGRFILLLKMSLWFSPVRSGLIDYFLLTMHCKVMSHLFLLYSSSQDDLNVGIYMCSSYCTELFFLLTMLKSKF